MDIIQFIGMLIAFIAVMYTIATTIRDVFNPQKKNTQDEQNSDFNCYFDELDDEEKSFDDETVFGRDELDEDELEEHNGLIKQIKRQESEKMKNNQEVDKKKNNPPQRHWNWKQEDQKFTFESGLEKYHTKTAIEDRKIAISLRPADELISPELQEIGSEGIVLKKQKPVLITQMLQKMPSKKMLIIAQEIISPPVGLRQNHLSR